MNKLGDLRYGRETHRRESKWPIEVWRRPSISFQKWTSAGVITYEYAGSSLEEVVRHVSPAAPFDLEARHRCLMFCVICSRQFEAALGVLNDRRWGKLILGSLSRSSSQDRCVRLIRKATALRLSPVILHNDIHSIYCPFPFRGIEPCICPRCWAERSTMCCESSPGYRLRQVTNRMQLSCMNDLIPQSTCAATDQACICTNSDLQAQLTACVTASCTVKEALSE